MKDKSTGKWAHEPAKPIPYPFTARLSDWWCAGRDARAGLPELPVTPNGEAAADAAADTWATPRMLFIGQLGRGMAEREWIDFQSEVSTTRVRLTQLHAKRGTLANDLARARRRLQELPAPTPEQLKVRVTGEERTSESVLVGRRRREHAERRRKLENEVTRIHAALTECDTDIAESREIIRIRLAVSHTRAEIIEAYVQRRKAAYLGRLLRKHPEGKRIGAHVDLTRREALRWATADGMPELTDGQDDQTTENGSD